MQDLLAASLRAVAFLPGGAGLLGFNFFRKKGKLRTHCLRTHKTFADSSNPLTFKPLQPATLDL
jgi:hypothetical protein